jgi:hypothetical protein
MTNEEKVKRLERLVAEKTSAAKDLKFVFAAETSVAEFTADAAVLREAAQLMRERGTLLTGRDWKTMYEAQERELRRLTTPEPISEKHRDGNWWLVWEPGAEGWFKCRWRPVGDWQKSGTTQHLPGAPTHALPLPGRPDA